MIIAALNESNSDTRVAITPNAVKHYLKLGLEVTCEAGAGKASGFSDADYEEAGATIVADKKDLLKKTKILVTVNEPSPKDLQGLPAGSLVIGPLDNEEEGELLTWCCKEKVSAFSMNLIPRISRAQSMDSLSSQANLAGYRAVLEGVNHFNRAIPMMMTAAGMIHPAKILILGAGVAGLQAIATAKRLGAVVYAFDVRRAAKEQVESLGAEFIEVSEEDSETSGGYAGETSEDYKRRQAELIDQYARQSDIVVSTALIPGRKAPVLLTKKTVEGMKPGSIIVDLATARGGNCELSKRDKIIKHGEVTLVGYSNVAGLVPATASELYATNLVNLIRLLLPSTPPVLTFSGEDEIIKQALLCHEGNYLPFQTVKEN
ncbi:Re/Si-specific NAD(P)(+) transhydrogenase subunit alpha [Legionella sp. 31fI33]|uniref:Re/Si-specific NAD(P)(+) transhydrogenase subunit alpha n=1 Tax=Legionella sp. 31fI33 TaxID=2886376 RepID=UPI001E4409D1|nr:Re/Si-specific NAD(P)(+) transhydrogenase subunit alpha [Legionella sp. 31fI33]MCC5015443.1 Re/Si-specific NAD(P)(+) transhydrogenase subunit alpha [Legionella sp. 31fI33]